MRKQDYLPALIRNLDANEKRYFKMQLNLQKGDKKYGELFDVLAETGQYDATALTKKMKKTDSQLSSEKEYLAKILFRAQRNFYEDATVRGQLARMLSDADMLLNKQQYEYCLHVTEKGIAMAEEHEVFEMALAFVRIHHYVYQFVSKKEAFSPVILNKESKLIKQLENEAEYRLLLKSFHEQMVVLEFKRGRAVTEGLKQIMQHPLLIDYKKALSVKAQLLFNRIWVDYHVRLSGNQEQTMHYANRALASLETNPALWQSQIRSYLSFLQILVISQLSVVDLEEVQKTIERKKALLTNKSLHLSNAVKKEITQMVGISTIALYNGLKNWPGLIKYFYSQVQGENFDLLIPSQQYMLKFWLAKAYLMNREPEKAAPISDELMRNWPPDAHQTMLMNHHLYLMIQYSLGNIAIMNSLLRGYQRWCRNNQVKEQEFKEFYRLMTGLVKAHNGAGRTEAIKRYRQAIKALKSDFERLNTESLHIFTWLDGLR